MTLRCFSYGGGVQSTAALVLAAQGKIDFPIFLFSNVGDDSEHPATLRYVEDVAKPYAAANGIELIELRHLRRDGEEETLLRSLEKTKSNGIPMHHEYTGKPGMRSCTYRFKIQRIAVWQRRHGATTDDPAITGLGISVDEFQRARTDTGIATQKAEYPLIDLRLTRQDCVRIIEKAGLPVPPKSSCWFCPYHSNSYWRSLQRNNPDLFDKSVALEKMLSDRNAAAGRPKLFIHRNLIPLDRVFAGHQLDMFDDDDTCESGFCMT